ncbi:MAG: C4-dicarboxylate TRAP transporter substrate-binding protein [Proteobacteria bacterium]|nr:C4-dicarboxylate TRAP transporter substrate-binding protein [Pseudomonadota bacterium]
MIKLGRITAIVLSGLTLLCILTLVLTPSGAEAGDKQLIRLKIGMAKPIQAGKAFSIVRDIFVAEVSRQVAEKTDYRIEWMEAYGGTVAKDGEVLEAVEMGLLDIGYVIFLFEPAKLFLHNFGYFVPFSSSDQVMVNRITRRLFQEFPSMTRVFEEHYKQKVLTVIPTTSYQMITTFPVQSIDDLKGKKIAAGGPNLIVVKPLGATPVQSAIGEGYTSFKTGVYEGWIILESIMAGLKWPEVAPYVTVIDLGAPPGVALTVNLKTWNGLPLEVREIISDAAVLLADRGCQEMTAMTRAVRQVLEEKMKARVSVLAPEERRRWAESLPNVAEMKAREADAKGLPGTKLIKRYIELQEEAGYRFPRAWTLK